MSQTAQATAASDTIRASGLLVTDERQIAGDTITADGLRVPDERQIAVATLEVGDSIAMSEVIHRKKFVPNSQRALWLGIIFPGGGQIYNRKYWKLPIFYGGFLGCIYALNWNNQMYRDYQQAYLDIMDSDPNTKSYEAMLPIGYDITGKEEQFKSIFKRKKDYYRKYRDLSIFAMIAVWALSVIDAYVDAELSTFDISTDLTLQVAPGMFTTRDMTHDRAVTNTGVSIGLRF
mgnify:FL=1